MSYLFPILIERKQGDLNHELSVYLEGGSMKLYSEETNYSFGKLHKVFQLAIDHLDRLPDEDSEILILGFGAGSIANILRQERKLSNPIIGIEKDAVVLDFFEKYFRGELSDCEVIHADAIEYLERCDTRFNLILIDLFIDREVPQCFLEDAFLRTLQNRLGKEGQILFNTMGTDQVIAKLEESFVHHFHIRDKKKIFRHNYMYYLESRNDKNFGSLVGI